MKTIILFNNWKGIKKLSESVAVDEMISKNNCGYFAEQSHAWIKKVIANLFIF